MYFSLAVHIFCIVSDPLTAVKLALPCFPYKNFIIVVNIKLIQ